MAHRKIADGRSIPVSKRHIAFCMFREGKTVEEVMVATGLTRVLAVGYRAESRAALGLPWPQEIVIKTSGLDAATLARLTDYLQDQCLPAFLAAQVKSGT